MPDAATKTCRSCSRELPADRDHFYRRVESYDGLSSRCRDCIKAASRERHAAKAAEPDPLKHCSGPCGRNLPRDAEHFATAPSGAPRRHCRECVLAAELGPEAERAWIATGGTADREGRRALTELTAALAPLVALTDEVPHTVADLSTPQGRAAALRRQNSRKALMESLRPRFDVYDLWVDMANSAADEGARRNGHGAVGLHALTTALERLA